jgi:hypothetical protein
MSDKVYLTCRTIFSATETIKAGERVVFYDVADGIGTIMGRYGVIKGVPINRLRRPDPPPQIRRGHHSIPWKP